MLLINGISWMGTALGPIVLAPRVFNISIAATATFHHRRPTVSGHIP